MSANYLHEIELNFPPRVTQSGFVFKVDGKEICGITNVEIFYGIRDGYPRVRLDMVVKNVRGWIKTDHYEEGT